MHSQWRFPAAIFLLFATAIPTLADVISIPAVSFVLRTGDGSGDRVGEAGNGVLQNATGKYYAPVILPVAGQNICRFNLVYQDNDADFKHHREATEKDLYDRRQCIYPAPSPGDAPVWGCRRWGEESNHDRHLRSYRRHSTDLLFRRVDFALHGIGRAGR